MANQVENQVVETRVMRLWQTPNGIVRVKLTIPPGEKMTLDDAKEFLDACLELGGGQKIVALYDLRDNKSFTSDRETRAYVAGESGEQVCKAVALLIGSPVSRMVGNFYLRISKPIYPTRLFTSEEEALAWLETFHD